MGGKRVTGLLGKLCHGTIFQFDYDLDCRDPEACSSMAYRKDFTVGGKV